MNKKFMYLCPKINVLVHKGMKSKGNLEAGKAVKTLLVSQKNEFPYFCMVKEENAKHKDFNSENGLGTSSH